MSRARQLSGLLQGIGGDLQAQVNALVAELDALTDVVTTQGSTISSHTVSIASLLSTVGSHTSSISSLASLITQLQGLPGLLANYADNYGSVPVGSAPQYFWRTLNHLDIGNVVTGSKFLVVGQGQVRENLGMNTECLPALTWTAPGGSLADDMTGHNWFGFQAAGRNTHLNQAHYFDWCRVGILEFVAPFSSVRVHNRMRCKSSDADGSGTQLMTVGIGQGGIAALRLGPL